MATTYYFLSAPDEHDVLDWFRSQSDIAEEHPNEQRLLLFYRQSGALAHTEDDGIDVSRSPLVSIYSPKIRKSALWTVGEVHFLWEGASRFPALERLRKRFQTWLREQPIAWERKQDGLAESYGHYLEGSIKNVADAVYAFPKGLMAFEGGQYFVAEHDNDAVLDRLCRKLRLLGIDCA